MMGEEGFWPTDSKHDHIRRKIMPSTAMRLRGATAGVKVSELYNAGAAHLEVVRIERKFRLTIRESAHWRHWRRRRCWGNFNWSQMEQWHHWLQSCSRLPHRLDHTDRTPSRGHFDRNP